MEIGDLVHVPRYPYWGMGVVVGKSTTEVQVHWLDNNEVVWIMKEGLEVIG